MQVSCANAGQICVAVKRIYIHEKIYDAVRDEVVAAARAIKVGHPTDPGVTMGPIQNHLHYTKVR